MQNSTIHTTTTATNTRETERPTLAELLSERADQRQEQEIARAQQQQRERERERQQALDYVVTWSLAHVSDDLRAALRMGWAVDDCRLDEGDYDESYAFARAGYATIDIADCGIDDNDDARSDPTRDERWRITRERFDYEYLWALCGPSGYRVAIESAYHLDRNSDAEILDALAAYPAWLISEAEKRADIEQERIAARYAEEQTRNA